MMKQAQLRKKYGVIKEKILLRVIKDEKPWRTITVHILKGHNLLIKENLNKYINLLQRKLFNNVAKT